MKTKPHLFYNVCGQVIEADGLKGMFLREGGGRNREKGIGRSVKNETVVSQATLFRLGRVGGRVKCVCVCVCVNTGPECLSI